MGLLSTKVTELLQALEGSQPYFWDTPSYLIGSWLPSPAQCSSKCWKGRVESCDWVSPLTCWKRTERSAGMWILSFQSLNQWGHSCSITPILQQRVEYGWLLSSEPPITSPFISIQISLNWQPSFLLVTVTDYRTYTNLLHSLCSWFVILSGHWALLGSCCASFLAV